jgi:hypothetical protein
VSRQISFAAIDMTQHRITSVQTRDVRFPLEQGIGSDAVHSGAEYMGNDFYWGYRQLFSTGWILGAFNGPYFRSKNTSP